ncbi:MAG: NEW3 domain-containing protein [Burkholderiaceae bacterium]
MRKTLCILFSAILGVIPALGFAQQPGGGGIGSSAVRGLFLLSDYPAIAVRPGTTSSIALRLQNHGIAPARLSLRVDGVPQGWTATLLGGGLPVAAAMPGFDSSVALQLRLEVPGDAALQNTTLVVTAEGGGQRASLPIDVRLAKELPAKLAIEARLPTLRGGPRASFDYQFTIRNDSGKDVLASLAAQAPRFFETSFTEGYGSQQLSTVPVKAGESKEMKLNVRAPAVAEPGDYPIKVTVSAEDAQATADMQLQIVGQPRLRVAGREGLMNASAEAGKASTVPIVLINEGSAGADGIELSASAPSGWETEFEPKAVPQIPAGGRAEVQLRITPSVKSLAGDYMTTVRAASQGESASGEFRVSVSTSSFWGIIGAIIIAVAVLIMVGAVARFGRR